VIQFEFSAQKSAAIVAAGMAASETSRSGGGTRAVLLDALGTLLRLEPPAPRLRAALRERLEIEIDDALAERAIRAEIAYYRAHLHLGRDRAGLEALRRRCAEVTRDALGPPARGADLAALTDALLAALEFAPFPDAVPALAGLRERGMRIVVVSNWDVSLHERLAETGLAPLVDGAVASAELGTAKPDPAIFRHALALAGATPDQALHAGDSADADVAGARAAGIRAVLVVRDGRPAPPGVEVVASLGELPALLAAGVP
jgi:putative hydrolase of the HAD superfamily